MANLQRRAGLARFPFQSESFWQVSPDREGLEPLRGGPSSSPGQLAGEVFVRRTPGPRTGVK